MKLLYFLNLTRCCLLYVLSNVYGMHHIRISGEDTSYNDCNVWWFPSVLQESSLIWYN